MNPKVDEYLERVENWKEELKALRVLLLECGLTEDFKWRNPCYSFQGKNVVILGSFKQHCVLSFLKGALLKDSEHILRASGPNSRSAKIAPFTSVKDISSHSATLKRYIYEAMEIEKAGVKVDFDAQETLDYPNELKELFVQNPEFQMAFENLTKGRQRGYLLFFSAAKQSKTCTARIEKYENRIFDGKGMNDCVCGLSKKMPGCDGSHKQLETAV